ncbi:MULTISPECIES: acyl-CoA dehydrogenase family protein [Paenarthrobacter]|jgi:acyl-CoA dehydrogenase|uniref:acyl-CoA dehydrogenase family protein n=1 Tax=Paenarthrobacter TaxID=1742992 RepID=UPI00076C6A36|nr:acyl-CoA dehydrogenase family protein [Paenarthrobacter ureafaciens]KUR64038.1 acyl-CoA dehydrogenase [Arthrobacter sp. ATCC 21022]MBN9130210.1 acyl-CoA/acyl-ACP dehydrogenase [Paenarthrobacter ureafaciens]RWW95268.1 acyl-CoA dehydrogenase [Paenarthrobacter ureafaciens]UOD81629.1 acyl-CoA/acyl-ACP dehydrogenase [Paenarthrobacter ureafaciens]WNZ04284.1 acyl-CoA/acyl-ACP dehydrogenase [Paenarthrobacter ureafaciens]
MSITTEHQASSRVESDKHKSPEELRARLVSFLEEHVTEESLIAHDEDETYDVELFRALAKAGFVQLESRIGGAKAKHRSQTIVLEELGARATSMGVSFVVQYMGVELLHSFGTPEQQERFLAPLFAGDAKMSFALSEPAGGTDVARAMTTKAVQQPDGSFVINGAKKWIGGASDADYLIVLARTSGIQRSSIDGITMFIVPRSTPGIETQSIDTMGIRALEQCDIQFTDVRVPAELVLGHVDKGFRHVLGTLNGERLNGAAVALGIARGALDYIVGYVKERHAFGRPIGAFQALQHKLVDSSVKVESARLLLEKAALASDELAGADETLSAMAKLAAADAATTVTDVGMRAMGGWGFLRQLPMQRYFRDARLYTFAPLTDDMIRNYIGEQHLGLPRSY